MTAIHNAVTSTVRLVSPKVQAVPHVLVSTSAEMWDDIKRIILITAISIDVYYRIEWFELHTDLHHLLAPFFGS